MKERCPVDERFERAFLAPLMAWCEAHADRIQSCHLKRRAGFTQVWVVSKVDGFDFDLGKDV